MFCKNCQKEIDNDSKFCEFCRAKIENTNPPLDLKIREMLFNKKAICFWILLFGTVLIAIALFIGNENYQSDFDSNESFYTLLRLCIFFASIYLILLKQKEKNLNATFPFIVTGIVFNPFFLFRFDEYHFPVIFFIFIIGFFGYSAYKEYGKIVMDKKAILKNYSQMSCPEKLIAQVKHPEMKHLFDKIDPTLKQ